MQVNRPRSRVSGFLLAVVLVAGARPAARGEIALFERGDSNADGELDIVDAVHTLGFLFLGTPDALGCEDAADTTDDGTIDIADPVRGLSHLFLGAPAPPSPFGGCGEDPTNDPLGCAMYPPCDPLEPRFEALERLELDACQLDALTFADLDDDGVLDLVLSSFGGAEGCAFWSLLGNGDGTFSEASRNDGGLGRKSVATGDFDENGSTDVAMSASCTACVSVFLALGDGRFGGEVVYPVTPAPFGLTTGDLNGDGHLDLAVSSLSLSPGEGVSVLLGRGDGTFGEAVEYAARRIWAIAAGDLNLDGAVDLAVSGRTGGLGVLLGVGDGSFGDVAFYGVPDDERSQETPVALGDVNGDGLPDVVVADWRRDTLRIFPGTGDGTFDTVRECRTGSIPLDVAIGDLDRDGVLDLAVVNRGEHEVWVHRGVGDASFLRGVRYGVGRIPRQVAIGDVNGDGAPDLAVASSSNDNDEVSLLLGRLEAPPRPDDG